MAPVIPAVERAWQRQSVWSQTANKLKAGPSRQRSLRLVLTAAAAALALAGSQVKSVSFPASLTLAIAAALALAGAGLLRGRATAEQVRRWTRARSVSEALKTEVFVFLSGTGAYDGSDRDLKLEAAAGRLESEAGDLQRYTTGVRPVQRPLPDVRDVGSYLDVRVRHSQLEGYYERNARLMRSRLRRLKAIEIALALIAAGLAATAAVAPGVAAWAAVVTTAGGAVAAFIAAERYEFLWIEYSRTASELRRLLERRSGADGRPLSEAELVAECEQVISVQNQAWMAKWGEEDDAAAGLPSITGADYVEPSAETPLRPGQRVSHLFPRSIMEEYVLQRLTERTYWVSRHFYGSLFYVGERGVLLLDPFMGGAGSLVKAIASVTPLPVTAICYSHFHADHIGGARQLVKSLDRAPRVIASEHTATWMERFGSDLPRPTDVLPWPDGSTGFDDVELRLHGLPRPGHSPDHAVFLLAQERIGHSADLINIDQLPFGGFAGQDPLVLFKPNLEFARDLEFDWFSGGHGNIGERSDFDFYISYLDEVARLIEEEIPRPAEIPDLYLTDYLSDLGAEGKTRLLTELDNHFSFYLYGREIIKGEKPDRTAAGGGPGGMMGGVVGEWMAQRQQAIAEATPRILERLRPKYGRMYNFDDGQPINIRLLAQSMQASLSNR